MNENSVFTNHSVGLTVYSLKHGEGKIVNCDEGSTYSIRVEFPEVDRYANYTEYGRILITDLMPTLSFTPWKLPEGWNVSMLPDLELNQKVLVWYEPSTKFNRHFKRWAKGGKITTFNDGKTSWTSPDMAETPWAYWSLPEEKIDE